MRSAVGLGSAVVFEVKQRGSLAGDALQAAAEHCVKGEGAEISDEPTSMQSLPIFLFPRCVPTDVSCEMLCTK